MEILLIIKYAKFIIVNKINRITYEKISEQETFKLWSNDKLIISIGC